MSYKGKNLETIALHAGWRNDETTGSVAVPIHQTTSYQFNNTEHAANLFGLQEFGNIYTRIMNPTTAVLEERVAALEGGAAGLAVASGQTASAYAVQNIAKTGDNIVSSSHLYGGTYNQFKNILKEMGIEVRFVDPADPQNFAKATDDKTRAYFAETLPNPKLQIFPIAEVAEIGKGFGIPLIIDNTAAPTLARPLEHGAAVVTYSTTKYIGGHGTSIGGLIIDGGTFDWTAAGAARQPALHTPDPSYHGVVWDEQVTKNMGLPIAYLLKLRTTILRDLGGAMSPFNAWIFIQGLETLPLRMREHTKNARAVAEFLDKSDKVQSVIYPGLKDDANKARADRYLNGRYGALVGFELPGGKEAGRKFIDALKLIYHVANIGDARTLAIHPASTTHSQLTEEEQLSTGVTPGYIRLSVGIEHIDDILADIAQALEQASS